MDSNTRRGGGKGGQQMDEQEGYVGCVCVRERGAPDSLMPGLGKPGLGKPGLGEGAHRKPSAGSSETWGLRAVRDPSL